MSTPIARIALTKAPAAVDPRAVMAGALARMSEAHDALVAHVSDETIDRYTDACRDASVAFEALKLAGFERASRRRWPR